MRQNVKSGSIKKDKRLTAEICCTIMTSSSRSSSNASAACVEIVLRVNAGEGTGSGFKKREDNGDRRVSLLDIE